METLGSAGSEKTSEYECYECNFKCKHNSDWKRHISTVRHKNNCNGKISVNEEATNKYQCEKCNKELKSHSGLWKHKQKCGFEKKDTIKENNDKCDTDKDELIKLLIEKHAKDDLIITYLMKENSEFKNMMVEQQNSMIELVKNGINNTNNSHNTTNSHNKTFNLQFFLNETCKDAMNIMDFVELIKPQLSDLEKIGEIGYIEGISNLITTNLKELGINRRPVQCTDKKRETIYIKDENKWEKDDDNKTKLRKMIKKVANKNLKLIPEYKKKYPGYNDASSKDSNGYNKMMIEVMGGSSEDANKYENKVVHNISNFTTIEKLMEK